MALGRPCRFWDAEVTLGDLTQGVTSWASLQRRSIRRRCIGNDPGIGPFVVNGGRWWSWIGISGPRSRSSWEFPVVSKIFTILEGTSEIQRLIIARAIAGVHIK